MPRITPYLYYEDLGRALSWLCADDLEGHRWYFAQHVRDVPPGEARPPA